MVKKEKRLATHRDKRLSPSLSGFTGLSYFLILAPEAGPIDWSGKLKVIGVDRSLLNATLHVASLVI
jgi:hypothetical protein